MSASVNRIINEKGETLFLLRATRPFGWCLPGGKIDAGETSREACLRETEEETGIIVSDDQIVYIGNAKSADGKDVDVYETVLDYTPEVKLSKREHLNKVWIKVRKDEFRYSYTSGVYNRIFAGNTLDFEGIGHPIWIPEFLTK